MKIHKMVKIIASTIALSGIIILPGCSRQEAESGIPQTITPEVAVVTLQPQRLVVSNELTGRTCACKVAEVRPQVSGIIKERLFEEGSDVKEGQILFKIDPALFETALDNAKAGLSRAQANLTAIRLKVDRLRELLADKAVSQQDYDDASAALKQTEADIRYWEATVKTARINLKYTSVTAPISGRIGKSNISEGALVTAQQPMALATIQQLDPIYVDLPQSTAQLLRLRQRMEKGLLQKGHIRNNASLVLEDDTQYPLKGELKFRDITVDPTTGSVIVRAVFPNPNMILLPGMFVRAVVEEGINENAILVPQQGVFRDLKGNPLSLIVDTEDKVRQRTLTVNRAIGDKWLVSSGLTAGDRVIIEGMQKVQPGDSVKIVPFRETGNQDSSANAPATAQSN
ncbi:MAG: efflux RND transporter periplasmic adaptor subunit [Syntrophales bacterium]|jgi:membrane fusion protein (multidrug efflux system)|nr:efflux RND transporter periplasmic adaptor subunit [Syntrophales bacterium]MDY0045581.1 efflux RND transporter periplasmic adaptor subunit [Syntrophales bacterium]